MFFQLLGILSALVFIAADLPYIRDTFRGNTRPQRVTWGIALTLNIIGFANQYASGADNSLWLFGTSTVLTAVIFAGALKYGVGGYSRLDMFSILTAAAGIVLWIVLKSPVYSIMANLLVAVVALLPTYVKARRDPQSETRILWLGGMIGSSLATVSVGKLDWLLLITPLSGALLQGCMVYLLYAAPKLGGWYGPVLRWSYAWALVRRSRER